MNSPVIRLATEADSKAVMAMFDHSRSLMRASGNMTQWVGYPTLDNVQADILHGHAWIVEEHGHAMGTFALVPGIEPTYEVIDHGRWIDDNTPYTTMHRLAKSPGAQGVADVAFSFAKERYDHLRVDTHASNRAMRHLLDRESFVYCGIIYMDDGSPRVAYEWWRWDEVEESLREYIEREVLPRYDAFDSAHRRDHARRVMARAMMLYRQLRERMAPSDAPIVTMMPEMVYTAAAMHDLGLAEGRKEHHTASGRIIRACSALRRWFDDRQVELIAQAAEDHRASAATSPRSLLGCIVAEADRDVEPERIVQRTVEYGLSHYPTLDREGHWRRTLEHLHEKYAEGGYIKLWLKESPNAAPLTELRALIRDEKRLRILFNQYFDN